MTVDHWQYLIVLAACVAITLPLEAFGPGVYRQGVKALRAIFPVAAIFVVWDAIAIAGDVWRYNPRYVTGVHLPFAVPLEEVLFFLVIPMCGLLTFNAVGTILALVKRRTTKAEDNA